MTRGVLQRAAPIDSWQWESTQGHGADVRPGTALRQAREGGPSSGRDIGVPLSAIMPLCSFMDVVMCLIMQFCFETQSHKIEECKQCI